MWEPWLQFFVSSISHSARDAIELCDDLSSLHLHNKRAVAGNSRRSDIDEKKTDKLLGISFFLFTSLSIETNLMNYRHLLPHAIYYKTNRCLFVWYYYFLLTLLDFSS